MAKPETSSITLSARAATRLADILKDEPAGARLRIAVNGGGCSGFQYAYTITDAQDADDIVIARNGVEVLIDSVSEPYLRGAEIDWVENLIGASFQIHNPNARSACGCGTSFSV